MMDIWSYVAMLTGVVFWCLAWCLQRDAKKHLDTAQLVLLDALAQIDAAEKLANSVDKGVES